MMTTDRTQRISGMSTRQKVTAGAFALILIIIIWQLYGLFSGPSVPATPAVPVRPATVTATGPAPGMMPTSAVPQPAPLPPKQQPQPAIMSQREAELLKAQQDAEAKYLQALNELQMLRIERDIAETSKAIMAAKLDTITAQKNIVDLLKPPPPVTPAAYAQGLMGPTPTGMPIPVAPPSQTQPASTTTTVTTTAVEFNYSVISVSQLQGRWSAVLGYQGTLYNVYTGDILPVDRAKVISIDRSGVVLEKSGVRKRVSLVPII